MIPIASCRACKSADLTKFLDLGEQYLSDFRDDDSKTPKYPLVLMLCNDCKLVQLEHTTPQVQMYHDRYGFKSGISNSIKNDLKDNVEHALRYTLNTADRWLDIASNDGTLLSFVPKNMYRVGIDPVRFLCNEAKQHANRIICDYFDSGYFELESKFDVVTSISCFYDMPDPSKFVEDVRDVLAKDGVWIIQQNYLLTTMQLSAVDNICHEHLEYYTLYALEQLLSRFNLEVNEVYLSDVNGGSIRTVVSHKGTHAINNSVLVQREREEDAMVEYLAAYQSFAGNVMFELVELNELIKNLHRQGYTINILAASTRGATIWQSAGIDKKYIAAAVERNPAKVGKRFTAIDVPIISEDKFRANPPDYALIGPWFFAEEIMKRESEFHKNGGKFIVPLPTVKVI